MRRTRTSQIRSYRRLLLVVGCSLLLFSCGEEQSYPGDGADHPFRSAGEVLPSATVHHPSDQSDGPPENSKGVVPGTGSTSAVTQNAGRTTPFDSVIPGFSKISDPSADNSGTPVAGTMDEARTPLPPVAMQYGVNHAHVHRGGSGYGSAASARQHDWLRSIGANSIAITPFAFQQGAHSNVIVGFGEGEEPDTRDRTMRLDNLAAEVDSAHRRGLRVMVKPHVWSHDFWGGNEWHGTVSQNSAADHRKWWASYRNYILYYARFCQENGVDYFCIGTELVKMTTGYPDEWRQLIADVRKVYTGKLTYSAHWDQEWRQIPFWDDLDFIGIGAYYPLKLPDSASVDDLVAAWRPYRSAIDSIATRYRRHVLFLEVGYRAVAGTWREPWLYSGGLSDPDAQARAFDALMRAFHDDQWFAGLYVWKTFTDPNGARREGEDMDFIFQGMPGEGVLKRWWRGT